MGQAEAAESQAETNSIGSGTQPNGGTTAGTVGKIKSREEAKGTHTSRQEARAEAPGGLNSGPEERGELLPITPFLLRISTVTGHSGPGWPTICLRQCDCRMDRFGLRQVGFQQLGGQDNSPPTLRASITEHRRLMSGPISKIWEIAQDVYNILRREDLYWISVARTSRSAHPCLHREIVGDQLVRRPQRNFLLSVFLGFRADDLRFYSHRGHCASLLAGIRFPT